jgi:hypothetical protein
VPAPSNGLAEIHSVGITNVAEGVTLLTATNSVSGEVFFRSLLSSPSLAHIDVTSTMDFAQALTIKGTIDIHDAFELPSPVQVWLTP